MMDDFLIETDKDLFIRVSEGTGDNLLREDILDGYIDYINYSVYETMKDAVNEENEQDGGMILSKVYIENLSMDEIIYAVSDELSIDKENITIRNIDDAEHIVNMDDPEWDIDK